MYVCMYVCMYVHMYIYLSDKHEVTIYIFSKQCCVRVLPHPCQVCHLLVPDISLIFSSLSSTSYQHLCTCGDGKLF